MVWCRTSLDFFFFFFSSFQAIGTKGLFQSAPKRRRRCSRVGRLGVKSLLTFKWSRITEISRPISCTSVSQPSIRPEALPRQSLCFITRQIPFRLWQRQSSGVDCCDLFLENHRGRQRRGRGSLAAAAALLPELACSSGKLAGS